MASNLSLLLIVVALHCAVLQLSAAAAVPDTGPAAPKNVSIEGQISAQGRCECEDDLGDSCIDEPCCPPLVCVNQRCQTCLGPNAPCQFGQCCPGLGFGCLINPALPSPVFTCQPCIIAYLPCDPTVPYGVVGSCCGGGQCRNEGLGFICYPPPNLLG